MTHIRYSATTHVGHKRKVNEDSILALPDQLLWAVSDGMGGHDAGDFASQVVVDRIAMINPDLPSQELIRALRDAINGAHDAIRAEAEARGSGTIGATVVTLAIANNHFAAFWAGDSRLYRLQNKRIEMLTTDHSMVAAFVLAGQMTWDQAEKHPQSNAITRAVGVGDTLELEKIRGEILPGDRFLLCSDGLTKYATFDTLERVLSREPIETVADALQQIALDGGGADNISIIVIDVI
ncbi:protein phosphatase 2C domain-containing protein [Roseovarius sp. BRH_c41]|jgi:serine/threonine-protein phosphatase Stp1|uniref:PP2C family protein-serine/threonine phosphatase n=1 Tax=Roseovarius sp. BRH_c41 TaxID=1629709 RepID=UPI0005F1D7F8|nr:protein phosphatase 2C domain-containing protein [Roseovarius sp. BRH_c41]KJS40873.1 MAG: serine/threonine protein phosphatase [Roseovarius sp. BRH_c41]